MPKLESDLSNSATDRGNHRGIAPTFTPYIEAVRNTNSLNFSYNGIKELDKEES